MSSWVGGKGSAYRPFDKKKFDDNWDMIFGNKKVAEEPLTEAPKKDIIDVSDEGC